MKQATRRGIVPQALTIVGVAVLVVAFGGAAQANNWSGATGNTGCTSTLNMADNADHTFYYDSVVNPSETAADGARQDNLNPTDINTSKLGSPSPSTDVVLYDQYYTDFCGLPWSGLSGFTMCVSTNGASECEKHEVRFNLAAIDGLNPGNDKSLACHEFGHSVGLKHRSAGADGCMDPDHYYAGYAGHDEDHINANY